MAGEDQGFFLGGGALVSFSTSTPINQSFFFCRIPVVLENRRSSQGERGVRTPCTLPLDPPLYGFVEKPENGFLTKCSGVEIMTKLKNGPMDVSLNDRSWSSNTVSNGHAYYLFNYKTEC